MSLVRTIQVIWTSMEPPNSQNNDVILCCHNMNILSLTLYMGVNYYGTPVLTSKQTTPY